MSYCHLTDEMLVNLLSHSDEKAFEEIYHRYWTQVFRFAITKVHRQDIAEDLCHDVFLSLWQRRSILSIIHLEAFLIQSVKYGIINYIKANLMHEKHLQRFNATIKTEDVEGEYDIYFNDLNEAWHRALKALPRKSQEIFRLSKVENFSNKEVASQLNLSEKAVEYHITKALKIMRLHLKEFIGLLIILIRIVGNFFY
jgi:RNA polymerase sigma-70 factor (family 1)